MNEFAVIAIASILSSNIIACVGVGASGLQSEKRNFLFMLASSLALIVSTIISGLVCWAIYKYLLMRVGAEYLKLYLVVLMSVIMTFISRWVLKVATREIFFLFEVSYSLPIQTAINVGILLIVDMSRTFLNTMFELSMFCVGFLLVQFIFYAMHEKLDNGYVLKPARNVPVTLFMLSIVGMILYVIQTIF